MTPACRWTRRIAELTRWYRARGLPPMMSVPVPLDGDSPARALDDELTRRSWVTRAAPAFVMVADLPPAPSPLRRRRRRWRARAALPGGALPGGPAGTELRADPLPDDGWLAAYHYRGQREAPPVRYAVLTSAADQVFLSVRAAGAVLAIARVSLAAGWAGITAVEVSPRHRRQGLGGALTTAALALAAARGARGVFLQVEVDNAAGPRAVRARRLPLRPPLPLPPRPRISRGRQGPLGLGRRRPGTGLGQPVRLPVPGASLPGRNGGSVEAVFQ